MFLIYKLQCLVDVHGLIKPDNIIGYFTGGRHPTSVYPDAHRGVMSNHPAYQGSQDEGNEPNIH